MNTMVKRNDGKEKFDERKTYGSVYAACSHAKYNERKCEATAEKVTSVIKKKCSTKKEVKSTEIRKAIKKALEKIDKEVAFFYEKNLPDLKAL